MRSDATHYYWTRGEDFRLSDHFTSNEFSCHCGCLEQRIAHALIDALERLRAAFKAPIRVNSGYRCEAHQDALRASGLETAKGISRHTSPADAADISSVDRDTTLLQEMARGFFGGIGVAKTFVHVDCRPNKTMWVYNKI